MHEYLISKLYDARVNRIVEGTNEIQRVVISKAMLKKLTRPTGCFNQQGYKNVIL